MTPFSPNDELSPLSHPDWIDNFVRAGVLIDIFCNVLKEEKGIVIDPLTKHALLLKAMGVIDLKR